MTYQTGQRYVVTETERKADSYTLEAVFYSEHGKEIHRESREFGDKVTIYDAIRDFQFNN